MVVPFRLQECIARPTAAGQEPFFLVSHLEAVASGTGSKNGSPEMRLGFLAGLSHDIAKATSQWQTYIKDDSIKRGPPHAPLGAVLFAFWADNLIPQWVEEDDAREHLYDCVLDWARVIFRHHGALDDLEEQPPWTNSNFFENEAPLELLKTCHQADLDAFVRRHFPECTSKVAALPQWIQSFDDEWHYRQQTVRLGEVVANSKQDGTTEQLALRVVEFAARLIFADRQHAGDWELDHFEADAAAPAITRHAEHCKAEAQESLKQGAAQILIDARSDQQAKALENYRCSVDEHVLTLLLPTGYGKTLTGLRIALESVRLGRCSRIIYVAPYISILSQAVKDIEDATGIKPFLHHHMSVLELKEKPEDDAQPEDHQSFDLLDSWQFPIVATTFNQLFTTQFPARAQHCVKIPALDSAFVFVDEPQVIELNAWSVFLRSIALTAQIRQTQFLFTTATLPPIEDGISNRIKIVNLTNDVAPVLNRYRITFKPEPWGLEKVVNEVGKSLNDVNSVALIQNTVRDAIDCYNGVLNAHTENDWLFLAGPMLSTHKRQRINAIRKLLKQERRVGVICTQILEAGVNLSFRRLFRAFAYLSSIGQAAGRSNRHGEGDLAATIVFKYLRCDDDKPVQRVYRDQILYDATDSILRNHQNLEELSFGDALAAFYGKCWEQNPRLTSLGKFDLAAGGQWSELAGLEPFESYPSAEIFVPNAEEYLDDVAVLSEFQCRTADGLLNRIRDSAYKRSLSHFERKRLSAALRFFTVSVPENVAQKIGQQTEGVDWLCTLRPEYKYSERTGLAPYYSDEAFLSLNPNVTV